MTTTENRPSQNTLLLLWPLLLSIAFIMVGNGLQGTLLGVKANYIGFDIRMIGVIMSMYYCGFLAGCVAIPLFLKKVGHVRVFAGMASLASTTILLHGIFDQEFLWGLARVINGFSFAGLFIVCESWLNNMTPNQQRGRVFGAYIFITNFGLFSGQFLINLSTPEDVGLFILISILISLALLPLTLIDKPAPQTENPEKMPVKELVLLSPLAICGVVATGVVGGTMIGFAPVYLSEIGLTPSGIANYMGFFVIGCASMPVALGWFSDKFDRRKIITALALFGTSVSYLIYTFPAASFLAFFLGGTMTGTYTLSIAYMHDHIKEKQLVSATSTLIMINNSGAIVGPLLAGTLISTIGTQAFYPMIVCVFALLFLVGVLRAIIGPAVDVSAQKRFINFPTRAGLTIMQMIERQNKNGSEKA